MKSSAPHVSLWRARRDGLLQAVEQQRAVRQARERIEKGQFPDPLFRDLAFGDVVMRDDIMADDAVVAAHRRDREPLRIDLAVLAAVPDLALPSAVAMDRLPHLAEERFVVSAGAQHARRLADDFRGRVAGALGKGRIDAQDRVARVGHHHRFERIERDRRDAQFGFELLALGDVAPARAKAGERALRIADRHPRDGEPDNRAVLADAAEFEVVAAQALPSLQELGRDARHVFGMDQRAGEVGHRHAFVDGVAGVLGHRRVDPARLAVRSPPDFPVHRAVGDRAELLLVLAQLASHRRRHLHRAAAARQREPGEQREQQAQARSRDGDQHLGVAAETGLEAVLGGHRKRPVVSRDDEVLVGRGARGQMPLAPLPER